MTSRVVHDLTAQGCWQETVGIASNVGGAIYDAVAQAGTWIYNNSAHAVVWIKNVAISAKDHVVYVAVAIREGAATAIKWLFDTAYKTYQFVKPHIAAFVAAVQKTISDGYNAVRGFVQAHPNETLVGLTAFALGILLTLAIERVTGC